MQKRRSVPFALLLAVILVVNSIAPAVAVDTPYPGDISGLECEASVKLLVDYSIINMYPDGTFRPDKTVTRAEAVKMLVVAGGYRLIEHESYHVTGYALKATDVMGHWASDYIIESMVQGIFKGYDPATFGPDFDITYTELCAALLRVLGYSDESLEGGYPDGYIAKAKELELLPEVDDLTAPATRADFAVMLAGALSINKVSVKDGEVTEAGYCLEDGLKTLKIYNDSAVLRPFVLVGSSVDGSINAVKVTDDAAVYVWDLARNAFVHTTSSTDTIAYNFAAVCDTDADKVGDTIFVVNFEDRNSFWTASKQYVDPRAAEDSAYAGTYANAIPYGERLIDTADEDGFFSWSGAAIDYYNIVDVGDLENSSYYPTYDWLNSTGTDTLTLLSGFRTSQQTTGWACGVTSAIMVMEWYGLRGELNELDLSALREKKGDKGEDVWGGYTDTQMLINVFENLNELKYFSGSWELVSTYDFVDKDGNVSEDYLSTAWIEKTLAGGMPIMIGWNSFGGHWQVIIGYDNMGTETTADDVLILADPYDSTDHRNDGYNIQSYERFYYDYTQNFDRDFSSDKGYGMPVMVVASPTGYEYKATTGNGLKVLKGETLSADGNTSDDMLIPYGNTAKDLAASDYAYAKQYAGKNGMSGPASSDYFHMFDYDGSPYYYAYDFFNADPSDISDTLILLDNFKTSQQASEWTCGPSSLRMVLEFFSDGTAALPSEFELAGMRKNDKEGATTLDGMAQIFDALGGWEYVTTDDMDDDGCIADYCLYDGQSYDGLIPWCLENGIPVIIGWDEWGGHWQVIIGYDDMGTEATQDDVLILADPYDTTDHCQDGYVIESFERLVYGWGARFDERGGETFIIAAPTGVLSEAGLK